MENSKFNVLDASTLFFFRLYKRLNKTWFELSRVNLYRNDLRGNKNYFELAGGSSYREVRVTEGKTTVNV